MGGRQKFYNFSSVLVQKLMTTSSHLGTSRRASGRHAEHIIYGYRNKMSIIDSDKTLLCLRNAARFLGEVVRMRGRLHFANSNPVLDDIIAHTIRIINSVQDPRSADHDEDDQSIGDPFDPWNAPVRSKGGLLTNFHAMKLLPEKKRNNVSKMNISLLNIHYRRPDSIVAMNAQREKQVILEASKLQIPVVALVDPETSKSVFEKVTYPIPATESVQFVYLFCNVVAKTVRAMNPKSTQANRSSRGLRE
eukprot:TRINITY_DN7336_c0_g1_i1.p1 TRINITY_DN7336_c0_g1~~TRINITY_DN7336_c0_g1_i1.p1  ORF type:complete len:249 (-),score=20.42 TRINITY_DN7336_c0_g1_i1:325-1071(-)